MRCSSSACSVTSVSTASNMCGSGFVMGGDRRQRRPVPHCSVLWDQAGAGRSLGLLGVPLLEASHASTGVKDLLLAGVEGVAGRAHVSAEGTRLRGAAGREGVATGARDLGLHVVR